MISPREVTNLGEVVNEQVTILLSCNVFLVGDKCTILVSRSTNMAMVVIPFAFGKYVMRSVIICCHFYSRKGISCDKPEFWLWFNIMSW